MEGIIKHAAGEARCAHCNNPIPTAVEAWPGRRGLFFCDRDECQEAAKNQPGCRYISQNEKPCSVPSCTKFAPAGPYDLRHEEFVCSVKCFRRLRSRRAMGDTLMICACGCGREFRSGKAKREHYFFSRECAGRFKTAQVWARCGQHQAVLKEYFEGWARLHYRNARHVIPVLSRFAEFLNERGVTDLATVTPKIITAYLTWADQKGHKQAAYSVSVISVFYSWLIAEERSKLPNPVVPGIHRSKREPCEPRPLSEEAIDEAWAILEKRGNNRLKLAMALCLEAGLRISETANVRLSDVDATKQRVFVRRSKNGRTRTVPFGDLTKKYLELWLEERNPDCAHDHVLHGYFGTPATPQQLRDEFWRVLTKRGSTYHGGKKTNEDGLDSWSTHQLRHSMASRLINGGATYATIQAVGGWKSEKAMTGYTAIDPAVVERGYHAAIKRSKELAAEKKPARPLKLSEYVKQRKTKN